MAVPSGEAAPAASPSPFRSRVGTPQFNRLRCRCAAERSRRPYWAVSPLRGAAGPALVWEKRNRRHTKVGRRPSAGGTQDFSRIVPDGWSSVLPTQMIPRGTTRLTQNAREPKPSARAGELPSALTEGMIAIRRAMSRSESLTVQSEHRVSRARFRARSPSGRRGCRSGLTMSSRTGENATLRLVGWRADKRVTVRAVQHSSVAQW